MSAPSAGPRLQRASRSPSSPLPQVSMPRLPPPVRRQDALGISPRGPALLFLPALLALLHPPLAAGRTAPNSAAAPAPLCCSRSSGPDPRRRLRSPVRSTAAAFARRRPAGFSSSGGRRRERRRRARRVAQMPPDGSPATRCTPR
jgi:hypothetical protein